MPELAGCETVSGFVEVEERAAAGPFRIGLGCSRSRI